LYTQCSVIGISYIRDIITVNPTHAAPTTFVTLPQTLAAFPCLHRGTLLFRFTIHTGEQYDGMASEVESITKAFVLGGAAHLEMQELMTGIGMPRHIMLEEAMGRGSKWQYRRNLIEKNIYPILRVMSKLLRAKKEKERSAAIRGFF
jgi:hypothetical protein